MGVNFKQFDTKDAASLAKANWVVGHNVTGEIGLQIEELEKLWRYKEIVDTTSEGSGNIVLSGERTINGFITNGNRIAVVEQTNQAENGIYITNSGVWSRSDDAATPDSVYNGLTVKVINPSCTLHQTEYSLRTTGAISLGSTLLNFYNTQPTASETREGHVQLSPDGGTDSGKAVQADDARLSNSRTPSSHASSHTDGSDDIQDATSGQKGLATATQISKLDNIEAGADVTDAANVDAAGATMNTDTDISSVSWVVDEDNLASDDDTKVPTQQSVKAYVDGKVVGLYDHKGGYNASTNSPDLDTSPSGVEKGDAYTVSTAGTFFTESVEEGDILIADQDNPTLISHWTRVNKNISFGTTTGTACEGDDSRLSDSRTCDNTFDDAATSRTNLGVDPAGTDNAPDGTTSVKGKVELATDGETSADKVVQGNDSRLSDNRDPNSHASNHTDGTDDIQDATSGQKGLATATQISKLDNIETSADVTDETNVKAALNGATISSATVAATDKVLVQDADDSDNLKTVTAQSIADLGSGGSSGWIKTLVIANSAGIATGNHTAKVKIPSGITSIDNWYITAYDANQNPVSATVTADVRMKAWTTGAWTDAVSGDNLSGTQPSVSAATSALSASPSMGGLTAGEFLQVVISTADTNVKSLELILDCS